MVIHNATERCSHSIPCKTISPSSSPLPKWHWMATTIGGVANVRCHTSSKFARPQNTTNLWMVLFCNICEYMRCRSTFVCEHCSILFPCVWFEEINEWIHWSHSIGWCEGCVSNRQSRRRWRRTHSYFLQHELIWICFWWFWIYLFVVDGKRGGCRNKIVENRTHIQNFTHAIV